MAEREARALDKQGAAHSSGAGEGAADGTRGGGTGAELRPPAAGPHVSGQLFLGILPYNPTYTARPDNTGRALLRAGGHADVDLLGEHLFIPLDLNLFTDRDSSALRPSEVDLIGGVASTWKVPGGRTEVGARGEWDATADGKGKGATTGKRSQGYVDVRARFMASLGEHLKTLDGALRGGDISGWLTLGWFTWNPMYFARPDNTGRALLRYVAHLDAAFWRHLGVFADGTFFTDGDRNPVRPSELDLTLGATVSLGDWGAMLAYERDMPVDGQGSGLVQHMLMLQASRSFAWPSPTPQRRE